jgi:uncharacterized phage-associated protein
MRHPFRFKSKKSIEAILYIAQNLKRANLIHISKIMYFADKAHLEKYGRFICGDSYLAMKYGPVPRETCKILNNNHGKNQAFIIKNKFWVKPLRAASTDYFSESDLECLDNSIKQYGHLSSHQLTNLSHDLAWQGAHGNNLIDIEKIVATLANADSLVEYLRDPCPE